MYSDADIVLSSDWVPPLTIAPAAISTDTVSMASSEGRKKTSSVSFSVDENENQPAVAEKVTGEVKKSKVSATASSNSRNHSIFPLSDAQTLIISTFMGRRIHWRDGEGRHRFRSNHQRLQSKCIFKSIFKVISVTNFLSGFFSSILRPIHMLILHPDDSFVLTRFSSFPFSIFAFLKFLHNDTKFALIHTPNSLKHKNK